ncbi:hypothetical protein LCGC14_2317570, partial [marine sediment metagenome]
STIYDIMRQLVFELRDWAWCTARSNALAQLADPPTGPDHQYGPLPDNLIRTVEMVDEAGDEVEYKFEEGLLIDAGDTTKITKTLQTNVDASEVFIRYVILIEDEAKYPAWFAQLISLNIALYINEPLKQHTPHFNKVTKMMETAMIIAEEANAKAGVRTSRSTRQNVNKGNMDLVDAAQRRVGLQDPTVFG